MVTRARQCSPILSQINRVQILLLVYLSIIFGQKYIMVHESRMIHIVAVNHGHQEVKNERVAY